MSAALPSGEASAAGEADGPATDLPDSARGLGWAFLGAQVYAIARRGVTGTELPWAVLSMVLSAGLVTWFAAGVLHARPLRTGCVWLILVAGMLLQVISLIVTPQGLGGWIDLLVSTVPLLALAAFCGTPYYAEQRRLGEDAPGLVRPAIGSVLVLAVITGALGGITALVADDGNQIHIGL